MKAIFCMRASVRPGRRRTFAVAAVAALVFVLGAPAGSAAAASPGAGAISGVATQAASTLRLGAHGSEVRAVQRKLARFGYLPASGIDGAFRMQTWHAVVAFQGWSHLTRDGVVGTHTRSALSRARRPAPWSTATGMEIHLGQQVLLLVRHRRIERAIHDIHVSTGAGGATPLGHFRIYRRDAMSWSVPFRVWMPLAQYFSGGYAVHEFASVPAYPASHGCVRVPPSESRTVWQFGSIGMRVWTA